MQPIKRLRRSCEPCAANKIRCDGRGEGQCSNCARKGIECEYRERKRPGRAKKARPEALVQAREELPPVAIQPQPRSVGETFGMDEVKFLQVFNKIVNPIEPLLPAAIARNAVSRATTELMPARIDLERTRHAAHVAAAWAAVAHAAFLMRDSRGVAYLGAAQSALSHCFETPTHDTMRAYLIMASATSVATGLAPAVERRAMNQRYTLFARVLRQDLKEVDRELEACYHSAIVNIVLAGHDDEEMVTEMRLPRPEEVLARSPILGVMYYLDMVLMRLQTRARSGLRIMNSVAECERCLKEAAPFRRALNNLGGHDSCPPAQVMMDCIIAFWLFQMSRHEEALAMVARAIETIAHNPCTICRPKVWHTLHSTALWVLNFGHVDLAEQILTALRPTTDTFLSADTDLLRHAHILTVKSTEVILHHARPATLQDYSPAAYSPQTIFPLQRSSSTDASPSSFQAPSLSESPPSSPLLQQAPLQRNFITDPSLSAYQDYLHDTNCGPSIL